MKNRINILVAFLAMALCQASAMAEPPASPYIYILGVAQDAGYPQALCFKPHCMPGWENPAARKPAVSLAVINPSTSSTLLFEATPNLPEQLYQLNKEAPFETSPIKGIFLTHAHMGHYAGLMHLGFEAASTRAMPVYAMPRMKTYLETNGPWSQLVTKNNIELKPLQNGEAVSPGGEIKVIPIRVPHRDEYSETVGYRIIGPSKSALFIPDIDKWQEWETSWGMDIREVIGTVDYAFVDATFFNGDELPGRDMANIPHPSVEESMHLFRNLPEDHKARVYFIHFNHTNPLLDPSSPQAETVRAAGFNVSVQGMRLPL